MTDTSKVAAQEFATLEDVERAVELLSPSDELRIKAFARYRILGLGRAALGRDHEDLRAEAMRSTCEGAANPSSGRRWKVKEVTFAQHILGAMRSIASHWKDAAGDKAVLESDVMTEAGEGDLLSPLDLAPSGAPDQERILLAKEQLGAICRQFQDDDCAALVIEGMREGWSGPEVMSRLQISKNDYEAALKRIRYHVR